jgi:hypothetical protein
VSVRIFLRSCGSHWMGWMPRTSRKGLAQPGCLRLSSGQISYASRTTRTLMCAICPPGCDCPGGLSGPGSRRPVVAVRPERSRAGRRGIGG